MNKKLIWIPRIIGILYTVFFLIFSFDSTTILEFLIHNIPTIILAGATIYSWNNKKYSWAIWTIIAIITTIFFNSYRELIPFIAITLIPLATGLLLYKLQKKK